MEITYRTANEKDVNAALPLIYSASAELYDFLFKTDKITAADFLRFEFSSGTGFAGYKNVLTADNSGTVIATGCFYDSDRYQTLVGESLKNVISFYGESSAPEIFARMAHIPSIMQPPVKGELYLSNFGVDPRFRRHGIGIGLINHRLKTASEEGYRVFCLDVAAGNSTAEALYLKLGMTAAAENTFTGNPDNTSIVKRMILNI